MKKLSYSLLSVMLLLLVAVSCSKSSNDDAVYLLRTVPADASSVAVINVENALEKIGGKTDGSTIQLSKEHTKAIEESHALRDEDKQRIKDFCGGDTGMAFNSFVVFSAARSYITGLLNDPDKFLEYEKKQNPEYSVVEEDGARLLGPIAVIGNQFWICTGRPDVDQLKYYQKLNERQSYASSDAASLLSDTDKALTFVADVNKLISIMPDATYARLGSSLIFKDMAYAAGYVDINKQNVEASVSVLDSDMKPAELLLPSDKVDASVVKSLGDSGNLYAAMAISPKLTKKITDMAGSFMGGNTSGISSMLGAVDGTIALRTDASMSDVEAKIQTNGNDFAGLSTMLQNTFGMSVTRDGSLLTAVRGGSDFKGNLTSSKVADKMKGAWIALVDDGVIVRNVVTVARLVPEKKSLRLDVEIEGGLDILMKEFLK